MKGKSVTFRPDAELIERLKKLCAATERPMTYYLEKAIAGHLPVLEERYARELAALARSEKKTIYPPRPDEGMLVEERKPKKKAG